MNFDLQSGPGATRSAVAGATGAAGIARLIATLTAELDNEQLDLPSFPEVAVRVRKALADDQVVIEHVARVVSAEPALATRLLQLANSVALNPGGKRLTDLRTAIARMGITMARSATIAFAMSQLRRAEQYRGVEAELTHLWGESAHVAAVSHVIARRFTRINPDAGLLAGLLQNVGKLYLLTRAVRIPGVLEDAANYQRVVGEWHPRLTQAILRNWDVAEEIRAALAAAAIPDRVHEGTTDLADVLAVAGAIADLGPAPVTEQMLFLGMPAARRMNLDPAACAAAVAESDADIASLRQALGS